MGSRLEEHYWTCYISYGSVKVALYINDTWSNACELPRFEGVVLSGSTSSLTAEEFAGQAAHLAGRSYRRCKRWGVNYARWKGQLHAQGKVRRQVKTELERAAGYEDN